MTDNQIESEIQAKGLTAQRITPADVEANIMRAHYFTAANGVLGACIDDSVPMFEDAQEPQSPLHLLTFCVLELRNGFTVAGESACVSPENFNAETGRKIARQNAVAKIWPLMGYELKCRLSREAAEQDAQ